MRNKESEQNGAGEVITIGDVKAAVSLWRKINSYKGQVREQEGRKLKMPDALCELAEIGAKTKGIKG